MEQAVRKELMKPMPNMFNVRVWTSSAKTTRLVERVRQDIHAGKSKEEAAMEAVRRFAERVRAEMTSRLPRSTVGLWGIAVPLPDGKTVLAGTTGYAFATLDLEKGAIHSHGKMAGKPAAKLFTLSRDGGLLAFAWPDGPVHLWRLKEKRREEP